MFLEIVTPEKKVFSGDVVLISVPGTSGAFEVLNNHAPIISTLSDGKVKIARKDGSHLNFAIESGLIEVKSNKVILLAENLKELEK